MDNPYNLKIINNNYYIIFKSNNKYNEVEVTKEVFDLMNRFELDDLNELQDKREMNEFDRHIEHSELTEHTLNNRMLFKQESIEDLIIRKTSLEDLRKAINMLPEVQRRRIKLYYFDELTEKGKEKVLEISSKIDVKLEEKCPGNSKVRKCITKEYFKKLNSC